MLAHDEAPAAATAEAPKNPNPYTAIVPDAVQLVNLLHGLWPSVMVASPDAVLYYAASQHAEHLMWTLKALAGEDRYRPIALASAEHVL